MRYHGLLFKIIRGLGMKRWLIVLSILYSTILCASEVYKKEISLPIEIYYPKLIKAIKANHMNVLYELNLLEKFKASGYDKKFGSEFNKSHLKAVKTLLLCNGYVGNQVSNIDPDMMVLCPLRLTLISTAAGTRVVFVKSSHLATSPKIKQLLATLDDILIHTIDLTVDDYMKNAFSDDHQFIGH